MKMNWTAAVATLVAVIGGPALAGSPGSATSLPTVGTSGLTPSGSYYADVKVSVPSDRYTFFATRHFALYVPNALPAGTSVPLVVVLHGGTLDYTKVLSYTASAQNPQTVWPLIADSEKFIVAAPNGVNDSTSNANGTDQHWNDCTGTHTINNLSSPHDVDFIKAMVLQIETAYGYKINKKMIYATGISNGADMAMRLVREATADLGASGWGQIAAAAGTASGDNAVPEVDGSGTTYYSPYDYCSYAGTPVPIWLMKGNQDVTVPYNGGPGDNSTSGDTAGYWIPYELTSNNGQSNFPTAPGGVVNASTISNWVSRFGITASPVSMDIVTTASGASLNASAATAGNPSRLDGMVVYTPSGSSNGTTIGYPGATGTQQPLAQCTIYGSGRNEVDDCIANGAGHNEPSIVTSLGSSTFGNLQVLKDVGQQDANLETALAE